jgi:hypothetical protein
MPLPLYDDEALPDTFACTSAVSDSVPTAEATEERHDHNEKRAKKGLDREGLAALVAARSGLPPIRNCRRAGTGAG